MTQETAAPLPALRWPRVWLQALTRPSVASFEQLVQAPNVSAVRAGLWVFLSALVGYGGAGLLQVAARQWAYLAAFEKGQLNGVLLTSLALLLCSPPATAALAIFKMISLSDNAQTLMGLELTPLVAVGAVLGLMLSAGVTQALARTFGGTGTYAQLLYAFAAYLAPLSLVMSVVSVFPVVGYLVVPLALYGLVLNLLAIKAVHQFGWGETLASSGLIFFLGVIVVALAAVAVLFVLSMAAGNIYQNIAGDI